MILVVTGGRRFDDRDAIWKYLDAIHRKVGIELLVHGDAGEEDPDGRARCGADKLAGVWAEARGVPVKTYPVTEAEWKAFGKAPGQAGTARCCGSRSPTAWRHSLAKEAR